MIGPSKKVALEGLTMLGAAFGFVAALAWNEAVKALIAKLIPQGQGVAYLFVYAIAVTIFAVIISMRLTKLKARLENDGESQQTNRP